MNEKLCPICKQPLDCTPLGLRRPIHEECRAGTATWCRWFEALPEERKSTEGRLLYLHAQKKQRESEAKRSEQRARPVSANGTEAWEHPTLVVRLTLKGAYVLSIMDRPMSALREGAEIRFKAVPEAPRRGFERLSEAIAWAKERKLDAQQASAQSSGNGSGIYLTKALNLTEVL